MKIEKNEIIPTFFLVLSLILFGLALGIISYTPLVTELNTKLKITDIPNNSDCKNMDLEKTAECLRKEVSQFYNYNISNWKNKLTIDELKTMGGVCQHYTDYYLMRLKEIGFDSSSLIIPIGNNATHIFAVISNEEGYCILDQTIIKCVELGNI